MAARRRVPEFDRRADMIEATLDCIAELGIRAATVRAVAARAGVSNGLIRHHFASMDNLIAAAYRRTIEMMIGPALKVLESSAGSAHERMTRFIVASLGSSVATPRALTLWATFISQVHVEHDLAREHREGYLAFRRATETLIAEVLQAEGRACSDKQLVSFAIAVNAVIDGLWVEGCLSAEDVDEVTQIAVGMASVEAILGIKLPPAGPLGTD